MELSLWPACVKTCSFADQLKAAHAGGFDLLPIGPLTYRDLLGEGYSARDILAMAADSGIRPGHYDGFTDWAPLRFGADIPEAARAVFDVSSAECLDLCAELGIERICATGAFTEGEIELAALVDGFAAFCERAAGHGVGVDLEFIPMWGIPDLEFAWRIVKAANCANAGILFDSWHFCRGNPDMGLLGEIPAGVIQTVQIADAAADIAGGDLFEDCIRFRRVPGEGDLPLADILAMLYAKGGVTNIGPEIFSDELDLMPAEQAGYRVGMATGRMLSAAGFDDVFQTTHNTNDL